MTVTAGRLLTSAPTIVTRIIAAINAAVARAQTRYQCEQMLEIDEHILTDAGISKYDIRAEAHPGGAQPPGVAADPARHRAPARTRH